MAKQPLTETELEALVGDGDPIAFLNPRNALYRDRGMKEEPPSRREALRLMAQEPNLIRRPITVRGKKRVLGFDEEALRKLL